MSWYRNIFLILIFVSYPGFCKSLEKDINSEYLKVVSPNKMTVAFVRSDGSKTSEECADFFDSNNPYADQIWLLNLKTKKERLLVKSALICDEPQKNIIRIEKLAFSPDGKTLYFQTSAWATSGALHAVKIDNGQQHYMMPSNVFYVIDKGKHRGYLRVQQHRYTDTGSFEDSRLFTAQGKVIK